MKKYYFTIGMLLVLICGVIVNGITAPKHTSEIVFNDYVEETSEYAETLTRFVVENYDEIAGMEVECGW